MSGPVFVTGAANSGTTQMTGLLREPGLEWRQFLRVKTAFEPRLEADRFRGPATLRLGLGVHPAFSHKGRRDKSARPFPTRLRRDRGVE